MSIVRWRPFSEVTNFRDAFDRFWEDSFVQPSRWVIWQPRDQMSIDMYQTDHDVVIKAALPGVKPEDVDVSVLDDTVTLKAEMKSESDVKQENYICQETSYGTYYRSIQLPVPIDTDKAEARFDNGMLYLTFPKSEAAKPRQIRVNVQPALEAKTSKSNKSK